MQEVLHIILRSFVLFCQHWESLNQYQQIWECYILKQERCSGCVLLNQLYNYPLSIFLTDKTFFFTIMKQYGNEIALQNHMEIIILIVILIWNCKFLALVKIILIFTSLQILPGIISVHPIVRNLAVLCLGCCGLQSQDFASKHFMLFLQVGFIL